MRLPSAMILSTGGAWPISSVASSRSRTLSSLRETRSSIVWCGTTIVCTNAARSRICVASSQRIAWASSPAPYALESRSPARVSALAAFESSATAPMTIGPIEGPRPASSIPRVSRIRLRGIAPTVLAHLIDRGNHKRAAMASSARPMPTSRSNACTSATAPQCATRCASATTASAPARASASPSSRSMSGAALTSA